MVGEKRRKNNNAAEEEEKKKLRGGVGHLIGSSVEGPGSNDWSNPFSLGSVISSRCCLGRGTR
jgi:hypothetical protein